MEHRGQEANVACDRSLERDDAQDRVLRGDVALVDHVVPSDDGVGEIGVTLSQGTDRVAEHLIGDLRRPDQAIDQVVLLFRELVPHGASADANVTRVGI